eukprot:356789-Chlamydomonas_euryale.AAC.1
MPVQGTFRRRCSDLWPRDLFSVARQLEEVPQAHTHTPPLCALSLSRSALCRSALPFTIQECIVQECTASALPLTCTASHCLVHCLSLSSALPPTAKRLSRCRRLFQPFSLSATASDCQSQPVTASDCQSQPVTASDCQSQPVTASLPRGSAVLLGSVINKPCSEVALCIKVVLITHHSSHITWWM